MLISGTLSFRRRATERFNVAAALLILIAETAPLRRKQLYAVSSPLSRCSDRETGGGGTLRVRPACTVHSSVYGISVTHRSLETFSFCPPFSEASFSAPRLSLAHRGRAALLKPGIDAAVVLGEVRSID
ncbi:hypothetical protein SKAU_G00177980 [Synaphobranchus kaupii]|uniref:Uncharacterized protein n=1 Tax=Synaphobranchus kaupii TaxID=118154 RepID=A0A9Q1FM20_SYNKA|nr:hypothetical protein SKAU_G00177980 [Synaphobranchus kaupii]